MGSTSYSGGLARSAQQPQMVIKGADDPDRPTIGRLWSSDGSVTTRRMPIANAKITYHGHRRALKTYWPIETGSRSKRRW